MQIEMHFDKISICLTFTIVLYSTVIVESYKFLGILPTTFRSHFIFGASLMRGLARKGHEVYVISPYPLQQPMKNYHDIPFTYDQSALEDPAETAENIYLLSVKYQEKMMAKAIFESRHVLELMHSNHTFDAVLCEVFYSEALFGFSEHFKAPLIGLSTFGYTSWNSDMVGSPSPASYVPSTFSEYSDEMSFAQRMGNLWWLIKERYTLYKNNLPLQDRLYKKFFPHLKRGMNAVRANAAAVLVNSHVSLTYARPHMPNNIAVGGLHIKRRLNPLPDDLEKFISAAQHGVVYFTMGTNIGSKNYLSSKYVELLEAFKKMKQRVLWKLDDNKFIGRHNNVLIRSWFPQQAILAHDNVVVFITQGGLLSTAESIYHGTPIIGLPVIGDQYYNMAKIAHEGVGLSLSHSYVQVSDIMQAVATILGNKSFNDNAKEMSARFKDQPIPPLDLAVYWVERVARQKGAKHLHCAGLNLNFLQYYNIDGMILVFGGLISCCLAFYQALKLSIESAIQKIVPTKPPKPIRKKKKRN